MTDGPKTRIFREMIALFNQLDVETALSYYTDDAYYRYGSFPPVKGRDAIRASTYSSHLDFIAKMSFNILQVWELGDTVIAEMELPHELKDGRTLILPCTDIVRFEGDKVKDFRVFIDPSPLFAPAESTH